MLKVALTGNIASGKSVVADVWRRLGAPVVESDDLARRAVAPGTPGLERIVERWGPGILRPTGELDRAVLRDVVFRDPAERKKLEDIVHPEVERLRLLETRREAERGSSVVVFDIPLLFEVGLEDQFDLVVLVDAPEELRRERIVARRGLSMDEAQRMIDSQWPTSRKRNRADLLIENRGSIEALREEAARVWRLIEARREDRE